MEQRNIFRDVIFETPARQVFLNADKSMLIIRNNCNDRCKNPSVLSFQEGTEPSTFSTSPARRGGQALLIQKASFLVTSYFFSDVLSGLSS
jgi:hypothetical protein